MGVLSLCQVEVVGYEFAPFIVGRLTTSGKLLSSVLCRSAWAWLGRKFPDFCFGIIMSKAASQQAISSCGGFTGPWASFQFDIGQHEASW